MEESSVRRQDTCLVSGLPFPLPDIPVGRDVHLLPLRDRNVVMWQVGLCLGLSMASSVRWKQVPWVWAAPPGSGPLDSQAPSHHCSFQLAHTCFWGTPSLCSGLLPLLPLGRYPGCPTCPLGVSYSLVRVG